MNEDAGQQLDARHKVLEDQLTTIAKMVSQVFDRVDEDIAALDKRVQAIEDRGAAIDPIDPPPFEPEPSPAEPEPAIGIGALDGDTLTVGDAISIIFGNIPTDTEAWIHWFGADWDDSSLIRTAGSIAAGGESVSIEVPGQYVGDRILQVQLPELGVKAHVKVTVAPDQAAPVPSPQPQPQPDARELKPGNPSNVTQTPSLDRIGDRHEIAIAQWSEVPERPFTGPFEVGVVAHHLDGIDHVALSLDGGPWLRIGEASNNPRTNVNEYWATIPGDVDSGWHSLRAVAVPVTGTPVKLPTLRLHNGHDEALFPHVVLDAGEYDIADLIRQFPQNPLGWATIRAAVGVPRDQVRVLGGIRSSDRHVRFQGITRQLGHWDEHYGNADPDSWWWFDDCRIEGDTKTRWIVHFGGRQFYTDTVIDDINAVWQSANLLARNVHIERCWEDVCRAFGMMVNVTIDKVDRGQYTAKHPDLWQWAGIAVSGFIAQNVKALDLAGQGLFTGSIHNSAFVDVGMNVRGNYYGLQMLKSASNVLLKNFNVTGGLGSILRSDDRFDFQVPAGERMVIEGGTSVRNADRIAGVEVR